MGAQTTTGNTDELIDHSVDYINTFYLSIQVKIKRKLIEEGSVVLGGIMVSALIFFILLFSGMAAGWWLGDIVKNRALGFLLVGVFFLLVLILLFLTKNKILKSTRNWLVRKMYEKRNSNI
ncbi:MAG TPA: hypothetical protein PKC72_06735 [Chitinophagaceae bacterium]|nr:hypothetical protein [Chitinophagaceae bacterium]